MVKSHLFSVLPLSLLLSMVSLSACQNTPTRAPINPQQVIVKPNVVVQVDSDGDGVTNNLDQCMNTQANLVVDQFGCPVQVNKLEGLLIIFQPIYTLADSQLSPLYIDELAKLADVLTDFKNESIYIFGHELPQEMQSYQSENSLGRHRAKKIKDELVTKYRIDPKRIVTYDCGYRYPKLWRDNVDDKADVDVDSNPLKVKGVTVISTTMGVGKIKSTLSGYLDNCQLF